MLGSCSIRSTNSESSLALLLNEIRFEERTYAVANLLMMLGVRLPTQKHLRPRMLFSFLFPRQVRLQCLLDGRKHI